MYDRRKYVGNHYKWVLVADRKIHTERAIPYVKKEAAERDKKKLEARGYVIALIELFPPYVKGDT